MNKNNSRKGSVQRSIGRDKDKQDYTVQVPCREEQAQGKISCGAEPITGMQAAKMWDWEWDTDRKASKNRGKLSHHTEPSLQRNAAENGELRAQRSEKLGQYQYHKWDGERDYVVRVNGLQSRVTDL